MLHIVLALLWATASSAKVTTPTAHHAAPREVWISGSDIESPQMRATWALRDALEAEIARRNPRTPPKRATTAQTIIYLETVATADNGRGFKYTAWLADRQLRSFAAVAGECGIAEMGACARNIYRRLTGTPSTVR